MQDYKHYFFSLVGGGEGQSANNWKAALEALPGRGMGVNPKPGERMQLDAPHHGMTVMIDAGGNARGRIWLPTDIATISDGNAWYTHEIQVIADGPTPGSFVWAWESKGGASPRPFSGEPTPPAPVDPPQPPAVDLSGKVAELEAAVSTMRTDVEALRGAVLSSIAHAQTLVTEAVASLTVKGRTKPAGVGFLSHSHELDLPVASKP